MRGDWQRVGKGNNVCVVKTRVSGSRESGVAFVVSSQWSIMGLSTEVHEPRRSRLSL